MSSYDRGISDYCNLYMYLLCIFYLVLSLHIFTGTCGQDPMLPPFFFLNIDFFSNRHFATFYGSIYDIIFRKSQGFTIPNFISKFEDKKYEMFMHALRTTCMTYFLYKCHTWRKFHKQQCSFKRGIFRRVGMKKGYIILNTIIKR